MKCKVYHAIKNIKDANELIDRFETENIFFELNDIDNENVLNGEMDLTDIEDIASLQFILDGDLFIFSSCDEMIFMNKYTQKELGLQ
ncbi:hypothetical protein [Clostridioides difficile]|jgi:hypothetical protein|uniref:Uncharacterized protein n=1 Tax=Clostridioides difficile TaxID=1496 RepID=A0A9P3TZN3_CLODI|nr:hypothetical protein [Clostridioides difficile]AWH79540.1 hypothetical protein DDG61_20175 [Clostridioides difficile]AWH83531.1 hypothetical protein DDG63_21070 [Clostridioides difficile]EGT2216379.1 hypothetical protein [Clostridioides difficile]EGT3946253.1 hypothetical protein [Clostridioides difficile]EGT4236709.1 hypothetical protein [Clostridioides difficile]